jgi:predicted DNA-binding transcriptional regulator YafY
MYFPTTRVLTVLEMLQSHRQLSGPELAERLEVNIRTVRRYIMMLQDLGIPVETVRGRHGAYRLRPGFKLPPLMFTEDEALAVTLGLLVARRLGLAVAAPDVEGALAKVGRVLPAALRERVQAVQDILILDFPTSEAPPASDVVVTLCAAAQLGRRVWLRYQAWQANVTERAVDVYGIVCRDGFWYAVGYCHLRQDVRVFRLDRVLQAEIREETYTRPASFDCLEHVARAVALMPDKWLVEVLLETSLEEAKYEVPPALAVLEETEGGVLLCCYTRNLDWLARVLARLNCPFVVRQPPELRAALKRLAARLTTLANREP